MTNIYLAIDYGTVNIGVAVAEHMLATPLPPLINDQSLLTKLETIIATYHVTHILVGLPSGKLVSEIKAFANHLAQETNLPVTLHDETLSSQEAQKQLSAVGASRSKKQHEHSYSAAIILEDYLDSVKL